MPGYRAAPGPDAPPAPPEAVIVSDGYGDFLAHTLPLALRHARRVVVVTAAADRETQDVCRRLDVTCLVTWVHREGGGFDKARAINHGLAHLALDGWALHLDADIALPDRFSAWLRGHPLDPACVYGMDRYDCAGPAAWRALRASGWLEGGREWGYLIQPPPGCTPCARVGHGDYGGWLPIGHNQLWHPRGSGIDRYPAKPGAGGEHTDLLFAAQWPPQRRRLIADVKAVHLVTGGGAMGANWRGRTTPRFAIEED